MFQSQTKDLEKIFTCGICKKFLLKPVVLPCNDSICSMHVYEAAKDDEELTIYKCQVCRKDHKIPEDGFSLNGAIVEIMRFNFHVDEKTRKAQEIINNFDKVLAELRMLCKDPENFIYEYIHATINKIDLKRDQIFEQIGDISEEMLTKLKSFKEESKSNLKNSIDSSSKYFMFW